MRLSDAMATGRVLLYPSPGFLRNGGGGGCALGMAGVAAGLLCPETSDELDDYKKLEEEWPWLKKNFIQDCDCRGYGGAVSTGVQYIGHLFDMHVSALEDMTLDQLIDRVRSIEPQEPSEQQRAVEAAGLPAVEHATK